jgi:hypothetical protein
MINIFDKNCWYPTVDHKLTHTMQLINVVGWHTNFLTDSTQLVSPHGFSFQNTLCFIHNPRNGEKFRKPAFQWRVLLWGWMYSCRVKYVCDTAYETYRLAYFAIMVASAVTCTVWFLFAQMLSHDVGYNALEVIVEARRKVIKYVVHGTERICSR